MTFKLESDDLVDGGDLPLAQVLNGFGHLGENVSPHLKWRGAPEGTQSFVVTMFDPDAPTGSGWWHWGVVDIPGNVCELSRGAGSGGILPHGAKQTRTDFGMASYGGAAPPPGSAHHYVIRVRAVGVSSIGVDEGASGAMVSAMSGMHTLAEATLTATYGVK